MSRSVLVTGASTGIGAATAERLRRAGWDVIAAARKDADLERLRAEILERDAIIHSLRRRLGEDESGQGATVHELRPPEHRLQH